MDLDELTVVQLRAALQRGDFSCVEYAEWVVARLHASRDLNAMSWTDEETLLHHALRMDNSGEARRGARVLAGVPVAMKDNIDTVDLPTTAGTPALRGLRPPRNAPVAQALLDAGALLAGKANMHELALGITSNNAATGAVRNPWNRAMIAGGSSGGSAAAVAARIVPAALGTDTGASVRLPAALCGVVGFRPTVGRYASAGIVPISHTRDTAGPIARCVEDVMLLDRVLSGEDSKQPEVDLRGLRIAVPRGFYRDAEPQVLLAMEASLALLTQAGVELIEADIASLESLNASIGFPVALYEIVRDIPAYLAANGYALTLADIVGQVASKDVAGILRSQLGADAIPAAIYQQAMAARLQLQRAYQRYFEDNRVEAMIFPTAVATAKPLGEDDTVELNGLRVPTFMTFIRNTDPGSNVGIPGISLPAGLDAAGLPIGIELDGPAGSDQRLLAIARAIEAILPRFPRAPVA